MRYSRWPLLLFGVGLVLGLAVVSANAAALGPVAALLMALGAGLLPAALIADWWGYRPWRKPAAKTRPRRTAPGRRQPRKRR